MTTVSGRLLSWAAPKRRRRVIASAILRNAAPLLPRKDPPSEPVFILGAPRSGTTVLFDILNHTPQLASLDRETGVIWDTFHRLEDSWSSHAVGPDEITSNERRYLYWAIDRMAGRARYLDKLPRNTLRAEYVRALFPDAWFVFVKRDGRATVSSLMTGWRSGVRFGRGRVPPVPLRIGGYEGTTWKFLVPPGWRDFAQGKTLAEVCAFQWVATNQAVLSARDRLGTDRWTEVRYEDVVERPRETAASLLRQLQLPAGDDVLAYASELDRHVTKKAVTPPRRDKWREENGEEIERILPLIEPMMTRLGYALD